MAHGCTYCTDDFYCEKFTDEKHTSWCYGKDYPCKDRRISNADRVRGYTDEELAEWIERIRMYCANDLCGRGCPLEEVCYSKADTPLETLDWLKQEATDAGT